MDTHSTEEIDLQELAVRVIRYFNSHIFFILICSVVGLGLGLMAYWRLPNVYESQMIVVSDVLTKTYGERIEENINNLIKEENYGTLSANLNLTQEQVSSIKSIRIESITEVKNANIQIDKEETFFILTVDLRDPSILPVFQEGLLGFFRNNEYVQIRTKQREVTYRAMVKKIEEELQSIDSFKQRLTHGQTKGESLVLDPSVLYTGSVDLSKSLWDYRNSLELSNSIQLLEGFTAFQKPKEPNLLTLSVLGFLLGLLGSIGLLTMKELLQKAR